MANNIIGRVLATEKNPTTIDDFTFWTDPELILNPFDIVKVQHREGAEILAEGVKVTSFVAERNTIDYIKRLVACAK